jgi:hypothetical protein
VNSDTFSLVTTHTHLRRRNRSSHLEARASCLKDSNGRWNVLAKFSPLIYKFRRLDSGVSQQWPGAMRLLLINIIAFLEPPGLGRNRILYS